MSGSQGSDYALANAGFEGRTGRLVAFGLSNAAAASLAVVTLSLSLVIALAALSIKVMAATPIAG